MIAVLLGAIAARDYVGPVAVQAQSGGFAGVQFSAQGAGTDFALFDSRTGEIWDYSGDAVWSKRRVTKPGQALVYEQRPK